MLGVSNMDRAYFMNRKLWGDDLEEEKSVDHKKWLQSIDEEIENFKGLTPETIKATEEYLEELRLEASMLPKPKLEEHPKKYVKNASNCVTYSDPVFDPNNPSMKRIADRLRMQLQE